MNETQNKSLLVLGAGGHAMEILDVLNEVPYFENFVFYDDINSKTELNGYKILKSKNEVDNTFHQVFHFVVGVGQPEARSLFYNKFSKIGGSCFRLKSNTAFISQYSDCELCDIMKFCFIGPETSIGIGSLLNTGAQVHHQASIGIFCEISPKAVILGDVKIGDYSRIGANSTILPHLNIGSNVTVGAGSVVTKDLPDNCMAAGVPAVIKKRFKE